MCGMPEREERGYRARRPWPFDPIPIVGVVLVTTTSAHHDAVLTTASDIIRMVVKTVTVTVNEPPRQQQESPLQNPTKRVPRLYQAVRYVNVLKFRATVQQDGERRGAWLGQPPSAAPR